MTKYRKKLFTQESLEYLHQTMKDTAQKMGFKIIEFNGEADHVHLLVRYPPKYSISKLVNHLKGVSSRMYRSKYPMNSEHLWSPSYERPTSKGEETSPLLPIFKQGSNGKPAITGRVFRLRSLLLNYYNNI